MYARNTPWRDWVAVIALGIGSFTIVTAELAPIGLLSNIGNDLGVAISKAGLIVTVYAWIAAAAALFSAVVLSRLSRGPLLVGLMLVLALSSGVAAMVETFPSLMGARMVGALAHGAFWAMIGTIGSQIVPPHRVGLATSIIFGGVSAAAVFGVPLTNLIGTLENWRAAFLAVAALSLGVAAVCFTTLPKLPGIGGLGITALRRVLSNTRFLGIYVATALAVTSHFMAFTYIQPYLIVQKEITASMISPLLLAFGCAGLLANVVTGSLIDRWLKSVLMIALCLSSAALWMLSATSGLIGLWGTTLMLILWGGGIAAVFVGFQTWILKEADNDALPASAIYVAIFNAAIGLGAVLGSVVLSTSGLNEIFLFSAVATVIGASAIALMPGPSKVPV